MTASSDVNLVLELFISIIRSSQRHFAISGQYKMYVNICANADSCKLILKFFSKTEKNGTNANFDFKSVDDIFLTSFNFFCNSTICLEFFYPIIEKQFLFQYLAINTSDSLSWTVVLFLFLVLVFVCFRSITV